MYGAIADNSHPVSNFGALPCCAEYPVDLDCEDLSADNPMREGN